MKMNNYTIKIVILLITLVFAYPAYSDVKYTGKYSLTATPADFNKFLVFLSSAPFISVDGTFLADGLLAGDGLNFQVDIMGRTEEEIATHRQAAIDYFWNRFGIDVNDSRVYFTGFEVTPDMQYRVQVSSNEVVPSEGWPIDDGGWLIVVTDPAGIELGGDFPGEVIPGGSLMAYGDYKINRVEKDKNTGEIKYTGEPLIISYKSRRPVTPNTDGSFVLSWDIYNDEFGAGQAIGTVIPMTLTDGRLLMNVRNAITFPPFGLEVAPLLP